MFVFTSKWSILLDFGNVMGKLLLKLIIQLRYFTRITSVVNNVKAPVHTWYIARRGYNTIGTPLIVSRKKYGES